MSERILKVRFTQHVVQEAVCYVRVPENISREGIDTTLAACRRNDLLWSDAGEIREGPTSYEFIPPDRVPKHVHFLVPPQMDPRLDRPWIDGELTNLCRELAQTMKRQGLDMTEVERLTRERDEARAAHAVDVEALAQLKDELVAVEQKLVDIESTAAGMLDRPLGEAGGVASWIELALSQCIRTLRELRGGDEIGAAISAGTKGRYELGVCWFDGRWEAEHYFEAESEAEAHAAFEKELLDVGREYVHIFTMWIGDIDEDENEEEDAV
jgi:hypothetical protein